MVGLIVSVLDGRRDWTMSWSECPADLPVQHTLLCCHLLSRRSCPLGKGLKFYPFPFNETLLYKCQQMNPDEVINQFNRMKSLCTKR